ncbi:MAG: hypothetical protein AB1629_08075 [Candidatus Omnitrophota bacterium]
MNKEIVVQTWLWRGIEYFYLGFKLDRNWDYFQPFFDYMGIELFGKAYILAESSPEYEGLGNKEAKIKIDKIAKRYRHGLSRILKNINDFMGQNNINKILSQDFDGYTGKQIVKILEAGYIETRYPVPTSISDEYPIEGTDMHWLPLYSSGLSKFAYSIGREILSVLKAKFNVSIKKSEIEKLILVEEAGARFCRLFFKDNIADYVI